LLSKGWPGWIGILLQLHQGSRNLEGDQVISADGG
jgi:hypothetical protein